MEKTKKHLPFATQIFIALVLGIITGLCLQGHTEIADEYIKPWGTIFLNLLKFIVVPIVLFSIMSGIISMSDIRKVGSIGFKTILYYLCTTALAIVIGLVGGNLFKGFFPILETSDLAYGNPCFYRNSRCSRSGNGNACNGACICRTSS